RDSFAHISATTRRRTVALNNTGTWRPLVPQLRAWPRAAPADARSVPIPAVSNCNKVCRQTLYLLDYLVGAPDQRRRHGEAQRLCSLEIDHQLKASWVAPPEGRPASRPSRSWPHRWRRAYTYPGCLHRTIWDLRLPPFLCTGKCRPRYPSPPI